MGVPVPGKDPLAELSLPPGFRFYPTDEELLVQYLCRKVAGHHFTLKIIAEIDLYKFDPWVLPSKAMFGEKEWYFFTPRDRKYPNGSRPNRVAGSGYWKATGTDKIITTEGRKVGIKKALVFYVGKAPKGTKTNWIMHEYRLIDSSRKAGSSKLDDWVLCRIYKKNSSSQKPATSLSSVEQSNASTCSSSSHLDDVLESLPEIDDRIFSLPRVNSVRMLQQDQKPANFQSLNSGNFDWASLAGINFSSEPVPISQNQSEGQGFVSYNHNGIYASSIPAIGETKPSPVKLGKSVEEEVQSGLKTQRVSNLSVVYQNSNGFLNQNPQNTVDPYGFRFQNQFNAMNACGWSLGGNDSRR